MQRHVLFSFAGLVLIFSNAWTAPARPRYEPVEPPLTPLYRDFRGELSGTAWLGKYNTIPRIYILEADGTLSYKATTAKAKVFKNRGAWKYEGGFLSFEFFTTPANKLMEFRGKVNDLNSISGESIMKFNNLKSQQTLQRTTLEAK